MFDCAELKHVHQLHHFGRQLAILKRIYESYNLIIRRITNGPQQTMNGPQPTPNTQPISRTISCKDSMYDTTRDAGNMEEATFAYQSGATAIAYGVPITPAAAVRFERLKDRISLYALSEIQSCLAEKDSLMTLVRMPLHPYPQALLTRRQNFNLITIKESSYIERLTRITILLAKVTILFLPVSLMSAYFAVPLSDVDYTASTYWVTFVIVFILSFFILVIFGQLSGTQDAKPIYTSLTRAAFDTWQRFFYGEDRAKARSKRKGF